MENNFKIDIIIPFINIDHYRERNLKFILTYYNKYVTNCNIYVIEQDTETDLSDFDFITHYKIQLQTDFNKSYCLNYGVKHSYSKFLMLLDSDIIIEKEVLLNIRKYFNYKYVMYPFNKPIVNLNEAETNIFINAEILLDGTKRSVFTFGGGVILISRKSYYMVGGFDNELFVGWGGEDTAFFYKCERIVGVKRLNNSIYHLYHESVNVDDNMRNDIKKHINIIKNMNIDDLKKYASSKREYFIN